MTALTSRRNVVWVREVSERTGCSAAQPFAAAEDHRGSGTGGNATFAKPRSRLLLAQDAFLTITNS